MTIKKIYFFQCRSEILMEDITITRLARTKTIVNIVVALLLFLKQESLYFKL